MRLVDWARKQGIAYRTAWRWYKCGKLPVKAIRTPTGMILVQEEFPQQNSDSNKAWIYARVSSYEKKDDLNRQAARLEDFCRARGWTIETVVKEIASGMNDNRPKLNKLLAKRPRRLVVEYKDRLTRFGFHFFEIFLSQIGCDLVVVNMDKEEENDLMKDLIAVITSFCCRLYGLRRGHYKAHELKEKILCDAP